MVELLSREYEISYSHIDNRGVAKPSFLWSMMQDAATVHAEALGLGPAALGVVWVLSRIKATLTRPLLPYERVRCETWCPGFKGPSWYRCFAFYIDDVQVGEAQSMWVTLEPSTHSASDRAPGRAGLPVVHERRAVRPAAQAVVRQRAAASYPPRSVFRPRHQQPCQQCACRRADLRCA